VTALRRSQDRLATSVTGLDGAGLRAPSYASEWSIAQVLSHLGSQAEIFGLLLGAGLSGGDAPGQDAFPPIWEAWNTRSPEEQATDSIAANENFVARLEALDPAQRDAFRLAAFGMDLDFPMFLRLRLAENAVHCWDITVALDPSATVIPEAVELLVDGLPDLVARVGKPTAASLVIQVSTTDPQRRYALVTDGVQLEPWSERDVAGVLELSAEELLRFVYGRLDAAHAETARLDAGALTLDDLRAIFPGF
jgi:uncharacterized protein (TIGR03083 family)